MPRLRVAADRIRLAEGKLTGEGHVRVLLGEGRATGARFELDPAERRLVVEDGTWVRPDGTLSFHRAVVDLTDLSGSVRGGSFVDAQGRLHASGASLSWSADGRFTGRDLTVTTCGCPTEPLWAVRAKKVRVDLDGMARFTGGSVRLCGVPVLPVPAGAFAVSDRHTGLLLPRLGWGRDGWQAAWPAVVVLGRSADIELAPEWRQARGVRGLGALSYALAPGEGGTIEAAGGWDTAEGAARGAVRVQHGWHPGRWRTAVDGQWVSDGVYVSDFGDSYLARNAPWSELLAVAGFGPARLETDTFQPTTGATEGVAPEVAERPLGAVVSLQDSRLGPISLGGSARLDLVGEGENAWAGHASGGGDATSGFAGSGWLGRWESSGRADAGRQLGPLRVEAQGTARALGWSDGSPWAEAGLAGVAWLDTWGDVGSARHLDAVGVRIAGASRAGTADRRLPRDRPLPAWEVGPLLFSRWLVADAVPVSLTAGFSRRPDGWWPSGAARVEWSDWSAHLAVDPDLQWGRGAWDDGVVRLGAGVARWRTANVFQAELEGAWRLPGALSPWRAGGTGLADLAGGRWLSGGPTLGFHSRCDCLDVTVRAIWSADRAVPELGLSASLR